MADLDHLAEALVAEMQPKDVEDKPETEQAEPETVEASSSPDEPVAENIESEPETDDDEIVTLASLAADLEIPPEQLYGMRIPVEGHEPLTIGELKDIAQGTHEKFKRDESIEQELAERQAKIDADEAKLYAQLENVAPDEVTKAEAAVIAAYNDYNAIDWPQLEATNPGEAALRKQKLTEQFQIAQYNANQVKERLAKTREEIEAQRNEAMQHQQRLALQQLQTLIPEWRDEAVYTREREHMVNKLVDAGVEEAGVRAIGDPTLIKWIYDQLGVVEKIEAAAPKVKAPKVLKTSAVQSKGRGRAAAEKRLIENATKSKDARLKNEAMTHVLAQALGRR